MREVFKYMFDSARVLNDQNILGLLDIDSKAKVLDLGCDEGTWTMAIAATVDTKDVTGLDIVKERLKQAEKKGIKAIHADLTQKFPLRENSFDVVHANQVIEHMADLDVFVTEIYRVLKPGGYAVVSTENGSSWHNIFAALMGWQIFSLTNFSKYHRGLGNPLAAHRNRDDPCQEGSWTHKTILNYRGLKEFFEAHGFKDVKIVGAGYSPLPPFVGKLDPRRAHFITIKAYK